MRASAVVLAVAILAVACRWTSADEQLLIEFFAQSRLYDLTLVQKVGSVVFDPRTDGVVQRFEIAERRPERTAADGTRTRDLVIRADVRSPAGRVRNQRLVLTLTDRGGRWIVTSIAAADP